MITKEYVIDTLSAAISYPFFEQLAECTEDSRDILQHTLAVLDNLYSENSNEVAISVIALLYSITGLQFPQELAGLSPENLDNLLFSFLLDLEDYISTAA